jgi:hypothetical protein
VCYKDWVVALPAVPLGAVPILDVESVLARLPAAERARLTWAQKPIVEGLERLFSEPLADETIAEVARGIERPLIQLSLAFWQLMVAKLESARAELMGDLERSRRQITDHVHSDDVADTLDWVLDTVRACLDFAFTHFDPAQIAALNDAGLDELLADSQGQRLWRGIVALMAAAHGAKRKLDPERTGFLVETAFLELTELRQSMKSAGLWLALYPHQTDGERRQHLAKYAEAVRRIFTEEDWDAIQSARVKTLR